MTEEAERLFPKAYDTLLNQLISALKGRLTSEDLEEVLREVGRSLAQTQALEVESDFETRTARALKAIEALGGAARIVIRSESCPLAASVAEHPEVCRLAETLLSQIIGLDVRERCDREGPPRCRFELKPLRSTEKHK